MALSPRLCLILALVTFLAGLNLSAQEGGGQPVADACPIAEGCQVASGHYRILLPPRPTAERPGAIMYFHGYQGSAAEAIADEGLVGVARRLGVALIAPDGTGRSWSFPGSPARHRDEFAFVGQVFDDAVTRFGLDPARILASGFSQGGSMVWYLACRMPSRFAAFAPIAGAFWEPLPERCEGERPPLIHVHGTSDATVPLAGRALRRGYRQGDLFRSLAILAPGGCATALGDAARANPALEQLTCQVASGCSGPARLELCLHGGGHVADAAWIERAWRLMVRDRAVPRAADTKLTSP
ncbi:MAG TPA: PHB depolymerase family esterase [Bosea sp. (in: a-proteobacteria)]|jgi:polyhydroxybutyrate depolymerase|uniref:alpha/beta hydrolase family esterase n=1 Tax=Bosea sp. (in: a-proteobacteria) TaxID=1871050 RepID=UPI002E148E67|nr:PHB depolymerase family esterase [Bosea sp. (in: a-proteobacteria)]